MTDEDLKLEDVVDANERTDRTLVDLVRGLMMRRVNRPQGKCSIAEVATKIGMFEISVRRMYD